MRGHAASLAQRREILSTIAAVPGVQRVVGRDLIVPHQGVSDQTVRRRVRSVARAMSEVGGLSVSVANGRVRLRGEVDRQDQVPHLIELLESVKGVREIDHDLSVQGRPQSADRDVRSRLRATVRALFPKEVVEVEVIKGVVVLSGRTRSLAARHEIERRVARHPAARRVVNLIEVEQG